MQVVYIKHNNLSPGTRNFKPDTKGAELVPEMKVVSENIVAGKQNQIGLDFPACRIDQFHFGFADIIQILRVADLQNGEFIMRVER